MSITHKQCRFFVPCSIKQAKEALAIYNEFNAHNASLLFDSEVQKGDYFEAVTSLIEHLDTNMRDTSRLPFGFHVMIDHTLKGLQCFCNNDFSRDNFNIQDAAGFAQFLLLHFDINQAIHITAAEYHDEFNKGMSGSAAFVTKDNIDIFSTNDWLRQKKSGI